MSPRSRPPTASRGLAAGMPTSIIVAAAPEPDQVGGLRDLEPARQPGRPLPRRRAHHGQLSDGSAQRVRGERDRALLLRRPVPRDPLATRPPSRIRSPSSSACASRSTRCSRPAPDPSRRSAAFGRSGPSRRRVGRRDRVEPLLVTRVEPRPVVAAAGARRPRRGAAWARRRPARAGRSPARWGGAASSRSASATTARTRLRQSGQADTVAASRPPVISSSSAVSSRSSVDALTVVVDERELRHRTQPTPAPRARGPLPTPSPSGAEDRRRRPGSVRRMRAVVFPGDGAIEVTERPEPGARGRPGPVRVHGAGLNRADLPSAPATIPRRRACPQTSPAWSSPAWSARSAPACRRSGSATACSASSAAARRPRCSSSHETNCARVPDRLRPRRGRRHPGGVRHRARRPAHARRAPAR